MAMSLNTPDILMSIRFSDPEMSYFLEHQVMNDDWKKLTKLLIWSIEKGFITKKQLPDGSVEYDCHSKVVESMIRKILAFGRGSYFNRQPLETQAIMAAVIDKGIPRNFSMPSLPPSPPPDDLPRRKKKQ